MINKFGNKNFYYGVVEDRMDPLFLGRCRIRCVGLHTDNKTELPTKDLPWAWPLAPILSASMSGVGHAPVGPVEGTWVLITFNDDEFQQPFMMGTIGGIPFDSNAKAEEIEEFLFEQGKKPKTDSAVVGTGSGGIVVDSEENPVTAPNTSTTGNSGTDEDLNKIPTVPPPGAVSKNEESKASEGIKAIIAACKSSGITQRNAVAAILGIVGGESKWIPQDESYNYSASRLQQIFKGLTTDEVDKYSRAPSKGMSREEFFSFFYGPTHRGTNFLGNKNDFDGGVFYGRGFIQLTGRENYEKYGGYAGVDLTKDPKILNTDIHKSAKVVVAYFQTRCKANTDSSNYFNEAVRAVGHNSPDVAAKKREYYEYFLGGEQPKSNKDPLPEPKQETIDKKAEDPIPSPTKNTDTSQVGFKDPNKKYPKKDWLKEPDTHRLARRQKVSETIHQKKKDDRLMNITVANTGIKWDQPRLPYNAQYPYNHIYESESGHILEFDDTKNAERIHLYHTAGTFFEIDSEGNKSERVDGGSSLVVEEDSLLCIQGARHTHVGSDDSLIVGGQLQVQIYGNINLVVHGNVYQTVSGNTNLTTGGDWCVKAGGTINIQAGGTFNVDAVQVHLNSGTSRAPDTTPAYNPTIILPQPVSFEEAQYIELMEDQPERRKQVEKDQPPAKVEKSDEAPPKEQKAPVTSECDFPGDLTYETKLSPNFSIGSLCFEQGRPFPFGSEQGGLSDKEIACNMKQLCINILEPLKSKYADFGFKLNSGFRVGAGTSQHHKGMAADISFSKIRGIGSYNQQCEAFYQKAIEIRDSGLPYDQIILEANPSKGWIWIHVSFNPKGPRSTSDSNKVLTWVAGSGKGYVPGLHKVV